MERERANDDLILGIEVFDTEGHPLYSTDRLRAAREMPASWLASARRAGLADWFVRDGSDSAVGVSIENNFGLTVGYGFDVILPLECEPLIGRTSRRLESRGWPWLQIMARL